MATIDIEKQVAIYREKEAKLKRRIILCGGTGCVANGSLKVREALAKLLTEKNVDVELDIEHESAEEVKQGATYVSKSGCQGFCQMGPLMRIEPEGIMYVKVKEEDKTITCKYCGLENDRNNAKCEHCGGPLYRNK